MSQTHIWNHFSCNGWTHGSHSTFGTTIGTTHLAPDGHVAGYTGDHDDAATFRLVLNHLLSGHLCRVVDTHDIDTQ